MEELQHVLADKTALEEEKRAAQEEVAAQQRQYELARGVLEQQMRQLSGAISSKEALIEQLHANEAAARELSEQYLVGVASDWHCISREKVRACL